MTKRRESHTTFVGKVVKTKFDNQEMTLKHGDTVSSIQKCPRGAYTITLPASSLFVLPRKLDMGEAAASKWSRKMKL